MWLFVLWCSTSFASSLTSLSPTGYIEYTNKYCSAISCSDSSCTGGFHFGNESKSDCLSLCGINHCACFDWRDHNQKYPHPSQPGCRLTNKSQVVQKSGYGYTAFVSNTSKPSGASINYACQSGYNSWKFCDISLSIEKRLDELIAVMTPEEKASQLQARSCPPIDRLGIPFFCWGQNAITGLGEANFPIAPAMAATWNLSAVGRMARAIANNARVGFNKRTSNHSKGYKCPGSIVTWGPTMNINRDPRWGRNFETPSEDPYLTGAYAATWAFNAQSGEDLRYIKTIVTVKHWAAYSVDKYEGPDQPSPVEHGRDRYTYNADVDMYNFFDTYAPAFEMAVKQGNARGVMCSYNEVNGIPACMNPFLRDILRKKWGFDGYVSSDTDAISPANNHHNYSHTPLEAITFGLRDGRCDVESSVGSENLYAKHIATFLKNGKLNVSYVDQAIRDTFRVRMQAGLFDPMDTQPYPLIIDEDDAANDITDAYQDSIILLQNKNTILPLIPGKSIALIGPFASSLEAEVKKLNKNGNVTFVKGCNVNDHDMSQFASAIAAAKVAETVIMCLGSDGSDEHEYHDRINITLPGVQKEFAQQVMAGEVGKKTIVVLSNRGSLSVDYIKQKAQAILLAWAINSHAGVAVSNTIFGTFSPGGRLPYTVYPSDYINANNFFHMSMTSPPGRSYKYYTGKPLWPFGWGLSYTTFTLDLSGVNSTKLPIDIAVKVANTGSMDADEVIQVYFAPKWTREDAPLPLRQLIDFRRIFLTKGKSTILSFYITADQLRTISKDGTRSLVNGLYQIILTNGALNTVTYNIHV